MSETSALSKATQIYFKPKDVQSFLVKSLIASVTQKRNLNTKVQVFPEINTNKA